MQLRPSGQPSRPEAPPPAGAGPEAAPFSAEQNYPAIAQAPLFFPTRKPWAPPPPPPAPPPPTPVASAPAPLTNYLLVGVVVSGDEKNALIRATRENKTIMLGQGQQLGGWTLREITREGLLFAAGNAKYEMPLVKPSASKR